MPRIEQALMALGSWDAELNYDPDLARQLALFSHVRFAHGATDEFCGVILRRQIDRKAGLIRIGGRSIEWELGLDDRGEVIEDTEFISGTNKLSNPGFELGDLYWSVAENTGWDFSDTGGSEPHEGDWAAVCGAIEAGNPTDDILRSSEQWEANEDEQYTFSAYLRRDGGAVGRIRLRTVYEGRYEPSNLLTNGDWEDGATGWVAAGPGFTHVDDAGEAHEGTGVLRCDKLPPIDLLINGDFETGDDTDWATLPAWWSVQSTVKRSGSYALKANVATSGGSAAQISTSVYDVMPGATYRLRGYVNPAAPDVAAGVSMLLSNSDTLASDNRLVQLVNDSDIGEGWLLVEEEIQIPDDRDQLRVDLYVQGGGTTGAWYFDDFSLVQTSGRTASISQDDLELVPLEAYQLTASVRVGDDSTMGSLKSYVLLEASSGLRDQQRIDGPTLDLAAGKERTLEFDFTPPSGMDRCTVVFETQDIRGDFWWLDSCELVATDQTRSIFETVTAESYADYTQLTLTSVAPAGTEKVHVELVAESDANGWQADTVSFVRDGTPVSVAGAARILLQDETGSDILTPGNIYGDDVIRYDWRIRMLTNRKAITDLARGGLAVPKREWRTNPDGTFDFGEPDEIFTDRTDAILLRDHVYVTTPPEVEEDVEEYVRRVTVIGDLRETPDGGRYLVTGDATADDAGYTGITGRSLHRRRVIEESGVNHVQLAADLAQFEVDRADDPADLVHVTLQDPAAWWGRFDVGDWIYAYVPDTTLIDAANEQLLEGETIFPKRIRVLSRTWECARDDWTVSHVETGLDLTDSIASSNWAPATTCDLELGDLPAEFGSDPHGAGNSNLQFLKYRVSAATPLGGGVSQARTIVAETTGPKGDKGDPGETGATGATGATGDTGPPGATNYATPAVVLGTAAVEGVADSVIRSDATIVAFDATAPSTQAIGDAAAVGVAAVTARRDHKHAMPAFAVPAVVLGTAAAAGAAATLLRSDATIVAFDATNPSTQAIGDAAVVGVAAVAARRDHKHAMPAFATPAFTFDTTFAAGAAATLVRSDAQLAIFDATNPTTQAFGDAAAVGTAAFAARRDHKHAMMANPVAYAAPTIALDSAAAAGAASTLIRSDATIAAFDTTAPTTIAVGDAAAVGTVAFAARRDHRHGMFAQIAGSVDVLAGLVTQGLRAASSNPPLNLGTGALTAGAGSLSSLLVSGVSTMGVDGVTNGVLNTPESFFLNIDSNNNQSGTHFALATNRATDTGGTVLLDITDTGGWTLLDGSTINVGSTTGVKIGTATSQKIGFFNATPVVQITGSTDVLAGLVTLGLRAASSNPPLNLGTGAITAGIINASGQVVSTVATGTAPLSIASTTKVANLNADLLDDKTSVDFARLKSITILTVGSGTYTTPAGITTLIVRGKGAGGQGGGSNTAASSGAQGSGGGEGGEAEAFIATADSSYDYVVGAGGSGAGTGADGTAGGGTSFSRTAGNGGTNLVVAGGGGGGVNMAAGTSVLGLRGGTGGDATTGSAWINDGSPGQLAIRTSGTAGVSGNGGGPGGGLGRATQGTGNNATSPGAGGGGGNTLNGGAATAGGTGFDGRIVVYEFGL